MAAHIPVLSNEVIKLLDPQSGENFIDATFGGGGHARLIWEKIKPAGRLLAIDWNKTAIEKCPKNYECILANYANLPLILQAQNFPRADGLLLDLGISSEELEESNRGFSFKKNEPLLMTYSDQQKPVNEIINDSSEEQLFDIINRYGEERFARRIARSIKRKESVRPIKTTLDLVEAIFAAVPSNYERGRIHPATRTFMALRIYANQELDNLEKILSALATILAPGGRSAFISFHSLEDRLVKQYFRQLAKEDKAILLTKKPITPTREEILTNPRSRSAKLRALKFH